MKDVIISIDKIFYSNNQCVIREIWRENIAYDFTNINRNFRFILIFSLNPSAGVNFEDFYYKIIFEGKHTFKIVYNYDRK